MNIEKYLTVCMEIFGDHKRNATLKQLAALKTALENFSSNPSDEHRNQYHNSLNKIREGLISSPSNFFGKEKKIIADTIGASPYCGAGLLKQITDILTENNVMPAQAIKALAELERQLQNFLSTLETQIGVSINFHIEPERFERKEANLIILFPTDRKETLDSLQKESEDYFFILRHISEGIGADVDEIFIKSVSSSRLTITLQINRTTLAVFLLLLGSVYESIKEITEKSKLVDQVADIYGAPPEEGWEINLFNKNIEKNINIILEQHITITDEGRKNEIATALRKSTPKLRMKLQEGTEFDAQLSPEDDVEEDASEESTALGHDAPASVISRQTLETLRERIANLSELESPTDSPLLEAPDDDEKQSEGDKDIAHSD